jgi:hypothetical protein
MFITIVGGPHVVSSEKEFRIITKVSDFNFTFNDYNNDKPTRWVRLHKRSTPILKTEKLAARVKSEELRSTEEFYLYQ